MSEWDVIRKKLEREFERQKIVRCSGCGSVKHSDSDCGMSVKDRVAYRKRQSRRMSRLWGRLRQAAARPGSKHYPRRVVCAAMKMDDGMLITGVRHFSPDMRATMLRVYGKGYQFRVVEQGFIDNRYTFLSRADALILAKKQRQIIRRCGGDLKILFSDNLY